MKIGFCFSVVAAFVSVMFAPTSNARANTGLSHAEYQDLVFAMKLAPLDTFESYLKTESRLTRLNAPQKQALLKAVDQSSGTRFGYMALNMFVFPGLGSILQGDTVWGIVIGAVVFVAVFVPITHVATSASGRSYSEEIFIVPSAVIGVAAIMSWIRPWVYDAPRRKMLEGYYIRSMRLAPPSVRLSPIVVPPLALGRGSEALSPSRTLGFGLGLVGAF